MTDQHQRLAGLLLALSEEMKVQGLWEQSAPSPDALASTEPFCVDTLSFGQWVQWIMIPRFEQMIEASAPLPGSCSIQPIAEEGFKGIPGDASLLINLIGRIDRALTTQPH